MESSFGRPIAPASTRLIGNLMMRLPSRYGVTVVAIRKSESGEVLIPSPEAKLTTGDVLVSLLSGEPRPLARYVAKLPEALQEIINRALAKQVEHRCQTMARFPAG